MSTEFIPLTPPAAAGAHPGSEGFRPAVLSPDVVARRAFVSGVPDNVHPLPLPASAQVPGMPSEPAAQPVSAPVVTLQREGDRVTGIRVQCTCGEVIELNCVY